MQNLNELAARLRSFANEREWDQFHTPKNLLLAMVGEVGELAAELQWHPDAEPFDEFDGDLRRRIADETADVLIYLVRFADVCGIDLLQEANAKISRNEERYPVAWAKGSAAKYTERPGSVGLPD